MSTDGTAPRREKYGDSPLSRPRRMVGLLAALLLSLLALPAFAQAQETTASLSSSFSPNRLGASSVFTLKLHFGGGEEGVPAPLTRSVLHLPVGLELSANHIAACYAADLLARGPSGCSSRSEIGKGQSLGEILLGALVETEKASIWAFLGPLRNGNPTIEILGEGITPLERRVVVIGEALPDQAPYGQKLVMTVPPIETLPLEPNASVVNFSLTIGSPSRSRAHASAMVLVPHHCPSGGFPFLAQFSFEGGSSAEASAKVPCP